MKTKQQAPTEAATPDVDEQGQPIGGAAAEPPIEAVADVEPTPAPDEDPATLEEQRKAKIENKRFRDDGRSKIAARLSESRTAEAAEFRKQNPEQADLGEQVAGVPSADLIARMEAEARGEPDPSDAPAPAAAAPAATEEIIDPPLASNQKLYTIRTYGKEETLTDEQMVAEVQKARAAGIRFDDAATYEAQLEDWRGKLQAYADSLRARPQDGGPQPTGGSANPQPPITGAAGQVDKARLRDAQAALLRGDDEAATEIMAEVIASAIAQKPQAEVRSSEQGAVPEMPSRSQREPWSRDDRVKINEVFSRDFGDLLADDAAFVDAQALMNARLNSSASLGKTPEALAKEVGESVRRLRGDVAVTPTSTPTEQNLEARRTLKAQIPIMPPAGSARAPAAPQAPRFPTRQQYIQTLRQRSGSNSSR